MIKLFWNTHNQIKPSESKKDAMDYAWGIYHKENSNKWIYEILKKVKYNIIENEKDIKKNDIVIIVDSSIEKKIKLYEKLQIICSKIFLFHLGDESGIYNSSLIYKKCEHVWRAFCSNKYFDNKSITCIPIGYKSGIFHNQTKKKIYKWAFIGTPHKSSRHDLLFQLSNTGNFFCHKTEKFNEKIISVEKMSEVLSSTEFLPCPNGFVHPETYRLYEALECKCIPIVENAYKYYDRLFPNNPFIKIDMWSEANVIIKKMKEEEIKKKSEECSIWWKKYKSKIQNFVEDRIK